MGTVEYPWHMIVSTELWFCVAFLNRLFTAMSQLHHHMVWSWHCSADDLAMPSPCNRYGFSYTDDAPAAYGGFSLHSLVPGNIFPRKSCRNNILWTKRDLPYGHCSGVTIITVGSSYILIGHLKAVSNYYRSFLGHWYKPESFSTPWENTTRADIT